MSLARARVLLVEDDASIRRYVRMALEDLPLELLEAATLADARAELQRAPVDLLLTDLMLPDGHGSELLDAAASPGATRRVVFSAGIDARMRERLDALGVHAVLEKPVSLPALLDCVEAALAAADSAPAAAGEPVPVPAPGSSPEAAASATADATGEAERRRAIDLHFGGDAALYGSFRAAALVQFDADLAAGDAALATADLPALRRVAHNLKSALRLLGHDGAAEHARRLEGLAAEPGAGATSLGAPWAALAGAVRRLR